MILPFARTLVAARGKVKSKRPRAGLFGLDRWSCARRRWIDCSGQGGGRMTVAKILNSKGTGEVVTVRPGSTVADAARVLSDKRIGSVVVSPDGLTVAGILSERDIVREIGRRGAGCLGEVVDGMMTTKIVTCTREDRADHVMAEMTQGRFRHMPVVEDGKMIGLITLGDVVKYRLTELAMEKDALEGMIMGF